MKYCLKYSNICTKLNQADEISIKYSEDKGLVDFMKKFNAQRIVLRVDVNNFSLNEIRKLAAIKNTYPELQFTVALNEASPIVVASLKENNIPFYFAIPCTNWEQFNQYINTGVSDIDISGPLAFELSKVKLVLASLDQKVQVRATPNKCINLLPDTNPIIGFYIRPEDIDLYEEFIDILDFEGLEHQDTFFKMYSEEKLFIGNLMQCIYNFNAPVDNKGLITAFGERRRNCGRQCLNGGLCRRCNILVKLSQPMGDRARIQILDTIKKEEKELNNGKNISD